MNYRKLTGIVLKKQNYKEADQIASVYTSQQGKIRCVARSLRQSLSKLAGSFQDLSYVEFELTAGKALPVLISAKTLESFNAIKVDLTKTAIAFYGLEVVIKLTPDEQPNLPGFELLLGFLQALNAAPSNEQQLYLLLDNFSLRFLDTIGFSIEYAKTEFKLSVENLKLIREIEQGDFETVSKIETDLRTVKHIHKIIGQFIEYILERNIKSESFLKNIN